MKTFMKYKRLRPQDNIFELRVDVTQERLKKIFVISRMFDDDVVKIGYNQVVLYKGFLRPMDVSHIDKYVGEKYTIS